MIVGFKPAWTNKCPKIDVVEVFPCEPDITIVNLSLQIIWRSLDLLKHGILFFFASLISGLFFIAEE